MNSVLRRYLSEVGPATLFYFGSVAAAMLFAKQVDAGLPRLLVSLLPLPSIVLLAWVEIRRISRRDELRRRIEVEAITTAFVLSFGTMVTLSFLELGKAISLPLPLVTAAMVMTASWAIGHIVVRIRYQYWCVLSDRGNAD